VLYTIKDGEAWITCNVLLTPHSDPYAEANEMAALCDELMTPTLNPV